MQQAIITAQLTSLMSASSPRMNYYQRKASKFQPQMIVPNNSPTTSGQRSARKPTSPAQHGKFIKQSTITPLENTPEYNPISAVPRTPWNSPIPVTQSTYMNHLFSPVNTSFLALNGHNQTSRTYTSASPLRFNYYQNNFQQTVCPSGTKLEHTYEEAHSQPHSPSGPDITAVVSACSESEVKEKMIIQFNHSTATPHNSPVVSTEGTYSSRGAVDSFVELLCAGESLSEPEPILENARPRTRAVRMTDSGLSAESTKDRMIAQYLHSPATPYNSPLHVHSNLRLMAFDEMEIEIVDVGNSPVQCATQTQKAEIASGEEKGKEEKE